MPYSRITATGSYLPEKTLHNKDLEKLVDTTDEWIMKRVGIRSRHIVSGDETTVSMAEKAARIALERANLPADAIDMIVVGTATPDRLFPSAACMLQNRLGMPGVPAFDLNAACSGFIYGLSIADQYIRTGAAKHVLVVGVDSLSQLVDWSDRRTCVLFGDGAGAVVLSQSEEAGVLSTDLHADGQYEELLYAKSGVWNPGERSQVQMQGNEVFKVAVTKLGEMMDQVLTKCGMTAADVDWLIPHQANYRIISAAAKRLGLPMEQVILTVEEHGNTSAASIPLALDHAVTNGDVTRGQVLLLEAFGAGFAWGSALIRY